MKKTNLIFAIIFSVTYLILFNLSSFSYQCNEIRNNTIRLHILAESDNQYDQKIKYLIRDEFLKISPEIFNNIQNKNEALEKLNNQLTEIESYINDILKKNGLTYNADVTLTEEYFETRTYESGKILPAGTYTALKINLGNAKGRNWWCVIFPSLCIPAAETEYKNTDAVYSENQKNIISQPKKYETRFKIIEYIEYLKSKVDNK